MTQSSTIRAQLAAMEGALDSLPITSSVFLRETLSEMEALRRQLREAQGREMEERRRVEEERIRTLVQADMAAETARIVAANHAGCGPRDPDAESGGISPFSYSPRGSAPRD
jgi:hypothetical protein